MNLFAAMASSGGGRQADLRFVVLLVILALSLFHKLRHGRLVRNLVITETRAAMTRHIGMLITVRVRQANGTIVELIGRVEAVDATGLYLEHGQEIRLVAWPTLVELRLD